MISVIGLLLCFIRENATKKQKPFHTSRVVVTLEPVHRKARDWRLCIEISTDSASLRTMISGAFKFTLSRCLLPQSPVTPPLLFQVSCKHTMGDKWGKGGNPSVILGSFLQLNLWRIFGAHFPCVIVQIAIGSLLGFHSFGLDLGHPDAGSKPGTANRGEPVRQPWLFTIASCLTVTLYTTCHFPAASLP